MFSVIIPTWNNLPYLQLCIRSIREHSAWPHEVIVHVNDGQDGTRAWVQQQVAQGLLKATYSDGNMGICLAVNQSGMLATRDWVVYMNDDMYCLPGWDTALQQRLPGMPSDLFMLSGTMVEPVASGNACVVHADYGTTVEAFQERQLLGNVATLKRGDWLGSTWPPTLVHRRWWHMVGGYSIELSPGMSSDNDFSMKLWHAGCRIFLGVGDSLVYHFQCRSTGKVVKNDGRRQFLDKWGMTQSTFDKFYLKRGQPMSGGGLQLKDPRPDLPWRLAMLKSQLKRRLS
jgi:glycosyltransferase involved in cell wall biosynthesis